MMTKRRFIAAALAVMLSAGVAWACRLAAGEPAERQPSVTVKASAEVRTTLTAAEFPKLHALIKPRPGGFDDIPWMTSLWEARKKAAADGKPMLLWVGDGHPLGWT